MTEIYKLDVPVSGDPAGMVHNLEAMNVKLDTLVTEWKDKVSASVWWKFWARPNFYKAGGFVLHSLDQFIQLVNGMVEINADKKATVLAYLDTLYDKVVATSLPIFLMPFNGLIKTFVVYTLASQAIDFFVSKYREGSWKLEQIIKEKEEEFNKETDGEETNQEV